MNTPINLGELLLADYIPLESYSALTRVSVQEQLAIYQKELKEKITNHDQEIEQMCSDHYKSFIDCIQELLMVRPNAEGLKHEIMSTNIELTRSTDTIQRKLEDIIKSRRILFNCSTSIDVLNKCIKVLEEFSLFNEHLGQGNYFPALKYLDAFDKEYLPCLSELRFVQKMREKVPYYKSVIKEGTKKDLNNFLESLLTESQDIAVGDFCPLYRGLHIFSLLGARDEFIVYYKEQRLQQSKVVFRAPPQMFQSRSKYHDYMSSVVGFLAVEDHLKNTTKDFIDSEYLNRLWLSCIQSMKDAMLQQVKDFSRLESLFQVVLNTCHLEKDHGDLDRKIESILGKPLLGKAQMKSLFQEVRIEAEFRIYCKLNEQIDEFFTLASYDWSANQSKGQASNYLTDLIKWLRSTLQGLKEIPCLEQAACISACKHLAQCLQDLLLLIDNKSLSRGGLEQFDLDLMQCEVFACSEPVEGLQTVFAEVRQNFEEVCSKSTLKERKKKFPW